MAGCGKILPILFPGLQSRKFVPEISPIIIKPAQIFTVLSRAKDKPWKINVTICTMRNESQSWLINLQVQQTFHYFMQILWPRTNQKLRISVLNILRQLVPFEYFRRTNRRLWSWAPQSTFNPGALCTLLPFLN